jgi:hypothetical protein
MKLLIRLFLVFLAVTAVLLVSSCEKNNNTHKGNGTAEFSITVPDDVNQVKASPTSDSAIVSFQILISVEDMDGNAVFIDKLIPIYAFGTSFVSENIEIKEGEYKLTKFMVIDPSGEVVYAAPVAGSPLAYLINRPLPFNFSINSGETTRIVPEVLTVGDQSPEEFGYASFGVEIISPLSFWAICILDNPLIMAPTQITTAKLTVTSSDGWHYTFKLEAKTNKLVIRGGSAVYNFLLEKEGYLPQNLQFDAKTLQETSELNPLVLKIPWGELYRMLVLQPGPENGKDAKISNLEPDKNFGAHKYFEATFLSEPVLTVMRSNRSLISFNSDSLPKSAIIKKVTLQLWYDLPVPFDTIYATDIYPSTGIIWYGGVLQQIVEPWEENKVTWNTQPKTTEANQVYIPPFIKNANVIEVDVTKLFVNPAAGPAASVLPNYGMLFRLWPVDQFPGFRFASGDFPEPRMRPMLTIYYTL